MSSVECSLGSCHIPSAPGYRSPLAGDRRARCASRRWIRDPCPCTGLQAQHICCMMCQIIRRSIICASNTPLVMREVILELPEHSRQDSLRRHPTILTSSSRVPLLLLSPPVYVVVRALGIPFVFLFRFMPSLPRALLLIEPRCGLFNIRPSPPPAVAHRTCLSVVFRRGEE